MNSRIGPTSSKAALMAALDEETRKIASRADNTYGKCAAFANRGIIHQWLGQHMEGLQDFDFAIQQASNLGVAELDNGARSSLYRNRFFGRLYQFLFQDALADYQRAVQLNPKLKETFQGSLERAFERKPYEFCRAVLASNCPDEILAMAPACIIKSAKSRVSTPELRALHTELCNFYLTLIVDRDNITKNEPDLDVLIFRQALQSRLSDAAKKHMTDVAVKAARVSAEVVSRAAEEKIVPAVKTELVQHALAVATLPVTIATTDDSASAPTAGTQPVTHTATDSASVPTLGVTREAASRNAFVAKVMAEARQAIEAKKLLATTSTHSASPAKTRRH